MEKTLKELPYDPFLAQVLAERPEWRDLTEAELDALTDELEEQMNPYVMSLPHIGDAWMQDDSWHKVV